MSAYEQICEIYAKPLEEALKEDLEENCIKAKKLVSEEIVRLQKILKSKNYDDLILAHAEISERSLL
jgi:hypothetical protein